METTEKKHNYSRKREAILRAVRSTTCHPTAEWVYRTLKPEYPDLSFGTVYRNLLQFKTEGTIVSVGTVNGQERYDGNIKPHTHFICSRCGAVLDVPGDFLNSRAAGETAAKMGLTVTSCEVFLRGICDKCCQKDG
jgi:Fur family peroxide stress response transcriptional regulator